MSFMSGSDCSGAANPLLKLNSHAQMDTSIQEGIRNSQLNQRIQQGSSRQTLMDAGDKAQLDAFMSNRMAGDNFNFNPMARELEHMHRAPQMSMHSDRNNWSSEFLHSNSSVNTTQHSKHLSQARHLQQDQQQAHNPAFLNANQIQRQPQSANIMMNPSLMPATNNHMMHMLHSRQIQPQMQPQVYQQKNVAEQSQNWEDQFQAIETNIESASQTEIDEATDALDEMNAAFETSEDYLKLFSERPHDQYSFDQNNQFLQNPNAYEIGCKLMEGGAKLSEAALAFEAAVKDNPEHTDAWLKLGLCQIQNEKELQGITALENCLQGDPTNLTALMNLAISYINEGYDTAAFKSFERWIETKYPDVVARARSESNEPTSDDRYSLNKRITNLFIKAAQLSPSGVNIDADVQTGLGVLFYSMEEFDKTLDCFQAAIRCNPNDALSWNRLGASYANSNRPEQAIESYTKALQLNPNFVRARYNLGVSFINMGMYRDAVDHLLTGLSMHEVESPSFDGAFVSDTDQSGSLIETLKRAFLAMDRRDLIDKVKPGMNTTQFRLQYGF